MYSFILKQIKQLLYAVIKLLKWSSIFIILVVLILKITEVF